MSGMPCQAICKANGKQCIYPATYVFNDTEYICGVHTGKRKDEKFLIKNRTQDPDLLTNEPTDAIGFYSNVSGPYKFFSNLASCKFVWRSVPWKSSEAAFQAMKFYYEHPDKETYDALYRQVKLIMKATQATEAKKLGKSRNVPIRPDWDTSEDGGLPTKERFMFEILQAKFSPDSDGADLLLSTGDKDLEERSPRDLYWGKGANGQGRNRMGEILMMVRAHLQKRYPSTRTTA